MSISVIRCLEPLRLPNIVVALFFVAYFFNNNKLVTLFMLNLYRALISF